MKRTCSECGKDFYINFSGYSYKFKGACQCSYTCYDHAILRMSSNSYLTKESYIKYVKKSEETMTAQGKNILYPIKIKYVEIKN